MHRICHYMVESLSSVPSLSTAVLNAVISYQLCLPNNENDDDTRSSEHMHIEKFYLPPYNITLQLAHM
jgi:hypothetical protein